MPNAVVRVRHLWEVFTPQLVGEEDLEVLQGYFIKELQAAGFLLVPREGCPYPDDSQRTPMAIAGPKQLAKPLLGLRRFVAVAYAASRCTWDVRDAMPVFGRRLGSYIARKQAWLRRI